MTTGRPRQTPATHQAAGNRPAPRHETAGAAHPESPAAVPQAADALTVELIIQYPEAGQPAQYRLERTQHRVPVGTTIRQLLQRAAAAAGQALQTPGASGVLLPAEADASGNAEGQPAAGAHGGQGGIMAAIEDRSLGLSRFGRRAWLDDLLQADDRVEVLCPILADARAARFKRVAQARAGRTDGRWGRKNVTNRQIRATDRLEEK